MGCVIHVIREDASKVCHVLPRRALRAIVTLMRSVFLSCLISVILTSPLRADDILVFAAASLSGPLDAVVDTYEQDTGHSVLVSYGASSTLARQIEAGAPADVVILANAAWMNYLEDRAVLMVGTRHALLGNRLVLIGGAREAELGALNELPDQIGQDRLALALTEAVPAGIYARTALDALGLWERLQPNVVETDNVRTALQLVALGAVRFGIVYATGAALEPRVRTLAEIPETAHPTIIYPMAVIDGAGPAAEHFAGALGSLPARNIFTDAGFTVIGP